MGFNNNWAKIDWPDAAQPTGKDLNDLGKGQVVIGWGQTPGTVTVNYNQNHIAALGQVAFHASGYVNGLLPVVGPSGGTSASFTDSVNSTVQIKHGSAPITNSVLLEGAGASSVFLKSASNVG